MSVELSLLGKETNYPTQYQPEILFPIAREQSRENYRDVAGIDQGKDWWHVFEVSWLNAHHVPQVAIGRITLPANSTYLIESKSLKLYFNSLNFMKFDSQQQFIDLIEKDLTQAANAQVRFELFDVDALSIHQPEGVCLDRLTPEQQSDQPDATLLKRDSLSDEMVEVQLYSHLLRSNCPVTGQPDWGTVFIRYQGVKPCYSSILAYIISYRQHSGFHEQCVEQMFADLWNIFEPKKLMVYAAYTRRGGLDINPCRVSDLSWMPNPIRLARQ